jgi:hypothetical protein
MCNISTFCCGILVVSRMDDFRFSIYRFKILAFHCLYIELWYLNTVLDSMQFYLIQRRIWITKIHNKTVFLSDLFACLMFLSYILHDLRGLDKNVKLSGPSKYTFEN